MNWITDENGNRCSIKKFGSEEKAREALASLINCKNCSDCSDCSYCSDCSGCSYCSDCSRCSDCSYCSGCSYCSRCSGCSDCSYCSDCSGCSGCSDCSRCSGCSDCSRCSRCLYCSGCEEKNDVKVERKPEKEKKVTIVKIPVVEDLHKKIYDAVTQAPNSLNMETWHTCETTHCRAGWVVTLAGEEGKALESRFNTELAALMIYDASCPDFKINPARFYDTNEASMADMKKLAGVE